MQTLTRTDRNGNYQFLIEIDGVPCARFRHCAGLAAGRNPIDRVIGDERIDESPLMHSGEDGLILLEHGVTADQELMNWFNQTSAGSETTRNGAIIEIDDGGRERARWIFQSGRPICWIDVELEAAGGGMLIGELEFAYGALRQV